MEDAVIVAAVRSPMGRAFKGQFVQKRIDDLGADLIQALLKRVPAFDPQLLEDILIGCAMPEGEQGLNVARNIALLAKLPLTTGAQTINRFCGSSLTAINEAAQAIMCENGEAFIAGGIESMTHVPMGGFNPSLNEKLMKPGSPAAYIGMGTTAEILAKEFRISREDQDRFALHSHRKASSAQQQGKFKREIVLLEVLDAAGKPQMATEDEGPRRDTSMEALAALKPVFDVKGTVTAGNSSPLTDGGAMVLVMSKKLAKKLKLKPIAKIRSMAVSGVDPARMGLGPVDAVSKALKRAKMKLKDIDLIEINEAFAAQTLAVVKQLEIDEKKLNVHGGAVALGHPLGASGARIMATLLSAMEDRGEETGLITMCVGGGQGVATIVERL
ncbi:MAG: thiolase family protein [Deltaproteobacteria bacterium]|nr:thiolase family protein [Deltaproteobacteria bacterium]